MLQITAVPEHASSLSPGTIQDDKHRYTPIIGWPSNHSMLIVLTSRKYQTRSIAVILQCLQQVFPRFCPRPFEKPCIGDTVQYQAAGIGGLVQLIPMCQQPKLTSCGNNAPPLTDTHIHRQPTAITTLYTRASGNEGFSGGVIEFHPFSC